MRVILIVVGVVIIAAVYFFERGRRRRIGAEHGRMEPDGFDYDADDVLLKDEPPGEVLDRELEKLGSIVTEDRYPNPGREPAERPRPREAAPVQSPRPAPAADKPKAQPRTETPGATPEKIIVLHVTAHAQHAFSGVQLLDAFEAAGLVYGQMRIFHRLVQGRDGEPVFSIANILEPGWFDPDQMDDFHTPGITLFMRLPGPADCLTAFNDMATTAVQLAQTLHGELRDHTRSVLGRQTIEHMREEVREFQRRLRLAQKTV